MIEPDALPNPYAAPSDADRFGTDTLAGDPASPPSNVRWKILAMLMAYAALVHFNRISISAAGTEHIMKDYGIDETSMGMVYSSYLFVYTLFMLPGGWLLDKIGPKRAMMLVGGGSAILVVLTGLTGFLLPADGSLASASPVASLTLAGSKMLLALCVVRGFLGIISAPIHPSAARAVSFWMPSASRGMANGMVTGAAVTGVALTPFLFGNMMDWLGWPQAFVLAGCITLLVAIVWSLCATDHPWQHPRTNASERGLLPKQVISTAQTGALRDSLIGLASMFQNRSLVMLTLSYAAYSYFQYLFFYWQQYYFDTVLKLGKDDGRLYSTIITFAMVVGMLTGGFMGDRCLAWLGGWRGRAITPIIGMLSGGALLMAGIYSSQIGWVVGCFALAMGFLGLSESSFWVVGIELGGRRGGLSGAFLNCGGNVGGILAPVITPFVSDYFGWSAGLGLAAITCIMGAVLWIWIDPFERSEVPVEAVG